MVGLGEIDWELDLRGNGNGEMGRRKWENGRRSFIYVSLSGEGFQLNDILVAYLVLHQSPVISQH